MIIDSYLTDVDVTAQAVTFLALPETYSTLADEALFCNVQRVDVRSHYNSDAHPDHPAITVYFWKSL